MTTHARLILLLLLLAGCQTTRPPAGTTPPVAEKHPVATTVLGHQRVDDYAWLRQKDSPAVMTYLKAEDAYTQQIMKPTAALQKKLYTEMLARIQETDQSVPYRDGNWLYYHRTTAGLQYPVYCRKRAGVTNAVEEIILDQNQLATGKDFLDIGAMEISDDGNRLAYTVDTTGFREYTLQIKDLRTGKLLPVKRERVSAVAWTADNKTLFYVTDNDAKRSYRLWRMELGKAHDTLVYEEKDELFYVEVGRTRSKTYVLAGVGSKTTSEIRYLRADQPTSHWQLIAPRKKDHEYYVNQAGDKFYIRTNDKGRNFRLVTAPVADPGPDHWTEIVPCRPDVMLDDVLTFANYYVLVERVGGLPTMRVVTTATGQSADIKFPDPAYTVSPENNAEFNTTTLRYGFESLRTPHSVYDYDMATGVSTLLKQQPVKGYDASQYEAQRLFATASDGTKIPISLVYRKGVARTGLLLDGYGSYGIPEDAWFSSGRISLLDRGVAFAIAHVRGGGEFGKTWHDAGRMLNKRNTFTDFIACAETLIAGQHVAADRLAITGGSAGGLLMGAVLNMRPDLFHAALIEVPFVDVMNTMLDESLPLTVTEFEEWGNPKDKTFYDYMQSYSPYDNITATNYPALLVKTSLNDSQVMYWEPAKYVAKLRALKTDKNPLLLDIDLGGAGHSGKSGRYDALHEVASDYAFLLWQWGLTD